MTKEFGELLDAYIKREGFCSQGKFATEVGVSKTTIQRIIKGERRALPEMAVRLRKPLTIPIEDRLDFHLLSQGYSRAQIEKELGRPVRPISDIKPLVIREWRRGNTVIKLRY